MPEKFYLTTPIYYVNARPHIGHAYTTIVADVLARRHRLLGDDTYFLTGTDEHGQKIERSAAAAGIPPQQFADEVSKSFSELWQRMGIIPNKFIRTTDPAHKRGVQQLFTTLQRNDKIELRTYTGQYCVSEEMFVEGPPGTIGPDGRPTETVSEENYFFKLSEYQEQLLDLIEDGPNGKPPRLDIQPEARRNEVLSFICGDFAPVISDPRVKFVERQGEVLKINELLEAGFAAGLLRRTRTGRYFVPGALKDLSISRSSFTWGIPVPGDEKHVIYVWLDALANYMTAVGYGDDSPEAQAKFKKYWPADLHMVGKEIIRFHCVYWPAFLMAMCPSNVPQAEWNAKWLPKKVVAHGWLLFDDTKMSKSKGNIVRTETILDAFGNHYRSGINEYNSQQARKDPAFQPISEPSKQDQDLFAADVLRYFLLREIPLGRDGSFTFEALISRYKNLADGYGNLVSRTLKLVATGLDGQFHRIHAAAFNIGLGATLEYSQEDDRNSWQFGKSSYEDPLFTNSPDFEHALSVLFKGNHFSQACELISQAITQVDGYLSETQPWKFAKDAAPDAKDKLDEILYTAAESIRIITALLYPILPYATASVWRQLGLGDIEAAARNCELTNLQWGGLQPGKPLGPLFPAFPRINDKDIPRFIQTMADMEQKPNQPLGANAQADALTPELSEFPEAPIASEAAAPTPPKSKLVDESFVAPPAPSTTFDPAAGPRTASLAEPNPGQQVAGSNAATTERPATPPHTEAASGIFAVQTPADSSAQQETQITIDDFAKIELRVAQIVVCERIPKADKLLRLEVDLGYEKRQILSGIAEWYTPEELIGRRIVVITNLAPRKMRGLESHGMLLAASTEGGKPHLATIDAADLPLGSRLK